MIPLSVVNQRAASIEVLIVGKHVNLDLYLYFKEKTGRYPRVGEKVRFIAPSSVEIISRDTSKPALIVSDKWPSTGEIVLANNGFIAGAGGDGGAGAAFYRRDGTTNRSLIPHNTTTGKINSIKGKDGGPGISNYSAIKMNIENKGKIYGGGGGGGGSGAYAVGFAINANKSANVEWLSFAPNGDKMAPNMSGKGGGGGGAPYGSAALTTLSLDWFADTYSDLKTVVSQLKEKVKYLQKTHGQIRDHIVPRSDGRTMFSIVAPQNFSFTTLNNTHYSEFSTFSSGIYSKLKMSTNRWVVFMLDIDDETRATYRPYLPAYINHYDSKYLDGKYEFYKTAQTPNYSGSGGSSIAGMALVAQRKQQDASVTIGGVGGSLTEKGLLDGQHVYSSGFVGWTMNASTNKLRLTADSADALRGGNGGNIGEDGETGRLDKVYYRGGSTGNSYRQFSLPHSTGTRMETLPPAAGGKAGYIKTGNVTIINQSGGITKGR